MADSDPETVQSGLEGHGGGGAGGSWGLAPGGQAPSEEVWTPIVTALGGRTGTEVCPPHAGLVTLLCVCPAPRGCVMVISGPPDPCSGGAQNTYSTKLTQGHLLSPSHAQPWARTPGPRSKAVSSFLTHSGAPSPPPEPLKVDRASL